MQLPALGTQSTLSADSTPYAPKPSADQRTAAAAAIGAHQTATAKPSLPRQRSQHELCSWRQGHSCARACTAPGLGSHTSYSSSTAERSADEEYVASGSVGPPCMRACTCRTMKPRAGSGRQVEASLVEHAGLALVAAEDEAHLARDVLGHGVEGQVPVLAFRISSATRCGGERYHSSEYLARGDPVARARARNSERRSD